MARARALGYQALDEGDHIHIEPPSRVAANGGANPFVSRTPEEEAAAVKAAEENARIGAFIANAGTVGEIEAANAALKTGAEASSRARAERDATRAKREVDAQSALDLLAEAEGLIGKSTGSRGGYYADQALGAVGMSTPGANATAQLRTIAGQLVAKMPRMEGPQSNTDVQLYTQMAGDLANPMVPREQRMAAAKTIRKLNEKYARKPASKGGGDIDAILSKYGIK